MITLASLLEIIRQRQGLSFVIERFEPFASQYYNTRLLWLQSYLRGQHDRITIAFSSGTELVLKQWLDQDKGSNERAIISAATLRFGTVDLGRDGDESGNQSSSDTTEIPEGQQVPWLLQDAIHARPDVFQEVVLDTTEYMPQVDPVGERWIVQVEKLVRLSLVRRLSLDGEWIWAKHVFDLALPYLTSLRLRMSQQPSNVFHHGCSGNGSTEDSQDSDQFFWIDFDALPKLTSLHIEGICKHVPVNNIAGPKLTSLKLHCHRARASVDPEISQRTPADIVEIAQCSPRLQCLQLDVGNISRLWDPSGIPGVDVNVELYSFLGALSSMKHLQTLRLFPPYVSGNVFTAQGLLQQQPLSDSDAVAMFLRLRSQLPALAALEICPSDYNFYRSMHEQRPRRGAHHDRRHDFQAMAWKIYAWGDHTILTSRQARKEYSQRQVWAGQRRLRTEYLRDTHAMQDNGTAGGAMVDDDPWSLDPVVGF